MSLTLEDVRRIRFRMARPRETGYAVADVDTFIDKVEESFEQFEKTTDLLRREIESASAPVVAGPDSSAELAEARSQVAAKDREISGMRAEIERLKRVAEEARKVPVAPMPVGVDHSGDEVRRLQAVNADLSNQRNQLELQGEQLRSQLEQTRSELERLRTQRVTQTAGQSPTVTVHAAEDAAPAVTRLLQMATDQATTLVTEAENEASRKLADAEQRATEIKTDARTRAERIESEARVNAEQLTNDAESRAARLDSETNSKRRELFADLERQQSILSGKVEALRTFEARYRQNIGESLKRLYGALDNEHPEPMEVPELAERHSDTPRLDALVGGAEQRR